MLWIYASPLVDTPWCISNPTLGNISDLWEPGKASTLSILDTCQSTCTLHRCICLVVPTTPCKLDVQCLLITNQVLTLTLQATYLHHLRPNNRARSLLKKKDSCNALLLLLEATDDGRGSSSHVQFLSILPPSPSSVCSVSITPSCILHY